MQLQKAEKTALVFGATGLVGGHCLEMLLASPLYKEVRVFNRRSMKIEHPKLKEFIIDFEDFEDYSDWIKGADLFCCLGTTRKKAGSKEAFAQVDYTYVYEIAKVAARNKVNQFLLVSAIGADKDSMFFYNQVKGEIETAVNNLDFWAVHIFRPSLLLGNRNEQRIGEQIAMNVSKLFNLVTDKIAPKYSAVKAEQVAKSMLIYAQNINGGRYVYEGDDILNC